MRSGELVATNDVFSIELIVEIKVHASAVEFNQAFLSTSHNKRFLLTY
jgi:hypothetical protein